MEEYIRYIEDTLAGMPDDGTLYRYKRKVLDEMTERANEITHAGLKDEKVLADLVEDEFPDLKGGYARFREEERRKQRAKKRRMAMLIGIPAYVLVVTFLYLVISFATGRWAQTWLIMEGGMSLLILFATGLGVCKLCTMRRIFHPIARVLIALDIMLAVTFVFLFCLVLFQPAKIWLVFIGGVIALLAADAIFAAVTRQKLAIINYLLYIPACTALLYVILAALAVIPWSPGWMIILLGVLADIAIIIGVMINNSKYIYRQEVEDVWNEN